MRTPRRLPATPRRTALTTALSLLAFWPAALAHRGLHVEIDQATELLRADPQNAALLVKRAHLYRLYGHLEESLADLERANELPEAPAALFLQHGLTLSALRRDAEAEKELTRFLDLEAHPTAYAERARVRLRAARIEVAVRDLSASLALKPDVELYLLRGELQEKLGRLDDAATGYRDGLERLGGAGLIRDALIAVEAERGEYQRALDLIDEALAKTQAKTRWLLLRTELLARSGAAPEAVAAAGRRALAEADRILELRPTGIHLCERARVLLVMGRLEAAEQDILLAIAKSPRYSRAQRLLEEVRARLAEHTNEKPMPTDDEENTP